MTLFQAANPGCTGPSRAWSTAVLLMVLATGHVHAFEFTFWPGPGAVDDKRLVTLDDGPCGKEAVARVNSMPAYSASSPFLPERVFELDHGSRVKRTWRIPVDTFPSGLSGDVLRFSHGKSAYSVTTRGKLAALGASGTPEKPEVIKCKLPAELQGSPYASCWVLKDANSRQRRILAFLTPCE